MSEQKVCAAVLRSGARCRSVATSGTEFCTPHLALVAEYGEDALRQGDYPRRRRDSTLVRVSSEHEVPDRQLQPHRAGTAMAA